MPQGSWDIYTMPADGTEVVKRTQMPGRRHNTTWSPDGRQLVYYAERGDQQDQVWVLNADGSGPRLLTGGTGHNIFPAFAPDGRRIIFTAKRDGATDPHIYTVRTDSTELKQL